MQQKEKVLSDVEYYRNEIIKIVKKYDNLYWLKVMYAYIKGISKN